MRLTQHEADFLATCLRYLAVQAPCAARIETVADALAGTPGAPGQLPDTIFARAVSMSAVLWAIDSGLVQPVQQTTAQRVLDELWAEGPVRPELLASQLHCLVGQPGGDAHCLWTCPAMAHANVGFDSTFARLGPRIGGAGAGLRQALLADSTDTLSVARLDRRPATVPARVPGYGTPVACRACGRDGTILGVDPADGWTVIEHHPAVRQREDGMWEVAPEAGGPRQCRYMQDVRALRTR